jgi:predicted acetyltransferase/N-acetylglutamate synthase-like GNAT family acetyltransferase
MKVVLRWPCRDDLLELEKANRAAWEPSFPFLHYFESLADSSFEKYIEILPLLSNRKNLPDGHVPCTFLIAFNEANEVVGRVSIRHELNEFLSNIGGHIGYGVTPSHRKKGYATKILFETLKYVRKSLPYLHEVLLTCDDDNIGSIKTIEKNGGRFVDYYTSSELKVPKRRYTISLPVVRRAKAEDAMAIHEAHMRSIQEVCSKDHSPEEISAWGNRTYNESMRLNAINNDYVWVVERRGKIEGFGHLKVLDKDNVIKGHIWGLYLTQKVLGLGLGKDIFDLMIIEAGKLQAKILSLESSITAHDFYKKLGFRDVGPMKTLEINGQSVRCFPMEMILSN